MSYKRHTNCTPIHRFQCIIRNIQSEKIKSKKEYEMNRILFIILAIGCEQNTNILDQLCSNPDSENPTLITDINDLNIITAKLEQMNQTIHPEDDVCETSKIDFPIFSTYQDALNSPTVQDAIFKNVLKSANEPMTILFEHRRHRGVFIEELEIFNHDRTINLKVAVLNQKNYFQITFS